MKKFDFIIAGNGILGYSTAFALLQKNPSLQIAVIGPRERTGAASIAAGAMLNCFAEVTNRTLASHASRVKFEMALKSLNIWPAWIQSINEFLPKNFPIAHKSGTFVILNSESGHLDSENYDCIKNTLNHYNECYEEINYKDIPGINPLENSRPLQAIYLPREGHINVRTLLEALSCSLGSYPGVQIIDDLVIKVITDNGLACSVKTKNGEQFSAKHIIIASGAYSQRLIEDIEEFKNRVPRMFAGMGYSILLQPTQTHIKHVIRTPNRAGACGLHALPRDDNHLYVGATNNVYFSPGTQVTAGLMQFLIQCSIEQIDQDLYKAAILGWHVGNRPVTIDTFPLIGKTSIQGLWLLTGTYRDGLHQSPLLAQHLAAEILGGELLFNNIFQPERAPIQTMTVEESINEYIIHYLAGAYEHGIHLPKFLSEFEFKKYIKCKAEKLYEQLELDFGLSPEILLMLEFDPQPAKRIASLRNYFTHAAKPPLSLVA